MGYPVSKVIIDGPAIAKIKDAALRAFHEVHATPEDSRDTQIFLICLGLHSYLSSIGIEPNFTVKKIREDQGDTTPLDDLG